jgi:hypothetical protein
MARVISFAEVVRARRREKEREHMGACVQILEANLRLVLHLFHTGPLEERPVRARQLRQLSELLEYAVRET